MANIKGGADVVSALGENKTECANEELVCITAKEKPLLTSFLKSEGIKVPNTENEVVQISKKVLNVQNESEIWHSPKLRRVMGSHIPELVLSKRYKPEGPANSTSLLNNEHIDNTLKLWEENGEKIFGKKFLHIPFQMIDFEKEGTELAYFNVADAIGKYDAFAVVLNTDVSSGRGKHWFCIYGDLNIAKNKIQIEYFNSSGNPPMPEVENWLEKTKISLIRNNIYADIIYSAPRRIQMSNTECGMWCLVYIKSRLYNKPPHWLYTINAKDADLIKYREQCFRL